MPERARPWQQVADAIGGRCEVDTGLASTTIELRGTVDGVRVEARGKHIPYSGRAPGMGSVAQPGGETVVHADAPGAVGLRLRMSHGAIGPVDRILGRRDEPIATRLFDAAITVITNDVGFARAWMDSARARDFVMALPRYEVAVERGAVGLRRPSFELDAAILERAVRAAAALARRGRELADTWRAAAAGVGARPPELAALGPGAGSFAVVARGLDVEVAVVLARPGRGGNKQLFTRVRGKRARRRDRFFIADARAGRRGRPRMWGVSSVADTALDAGRYGVEAEDAERTHARVFELRAAIAAVDPFAVVGEPGTVTCYLAGVVVDVARLQAAVELVTTVALEDATPDVAGPYR